MPARPAGRLGRTGRRAWAALVLVAFAVCLGCSPKYGSGPGASGKAALGRPGGAAREVPRIRGKRGTSINWSGYVAQSSLTSPQAGAVTYVAGSWTVPTVTVTVGSSYSSAWVGIDGYSDGTVEQLGTEQDWYAGSAHYYAWWEMYPKMPKLIRGVRVRPGDRITAEVRYVGNRKFTLSMTNATTGESFSTTQKSNAQRSSAEWIMEAPWSGGVLPLARFGTVPFGACSATLSGHTGPIGDAAWQNEPVTMTGPGGATIASPSALTSGGTAFSVSRVGD